MSTKNLSKTAIEGGRGKYNKWDRHYSHSETRADERAYLSEVKADPENYFDYDIPATRPVGKDFRDKLNPMYRWLSSQVGKRWDDVRSDVTKTFDTRTTAGRHIVHDHLLSSVEVTPDLRYGRYYSGPDDYTTSYHAHDFYVDAEGFLREKTVVRRKDHKVPLFNTHQIANWLSGRVVGKVGKKLFWFVPSDKTKKWGGRNKQWTTQWGGARTYYYAYNVGLRFLYLQVENVYKYDGNNKPVLDEKGKHIIVDTKSTWRDGSPIFRQDRKLNDKEMAFWNTIPEHYQTKVLERSPTYPNPPKPDYRGYYY